MDKVSESLFFVERQDPVMARWIGEKLSIGESKEFTGIERY